MDLGLSAPEHAVLGVFAYERDHLKAWSWEWVRANPAASQADYEAALNAEASVIGAMQITTSLLGYYITNLGGWANFVGFLLTYPLFIVMNVAPELGRSIPTPAEALALGVMGDKWGPWQLPPAPDFEELPPTRDPAKGNFVVEERVRGTLDGALVTLRRPIDVQLVEDRYVSTPGPWEVV